MKRSDLTLGGLFISLQLIFLFISKILVGSELILVIFLPLIFSFYSLKYEKKSIIVFLLASFILTLVFDPINTFIYIIPALLVGTIYGQLRKKEVKEMSLIYISSIAHLFSLIITLFSFKFFYIEFDLLSVLMNVFSTNKETVFMILSIILFTLSLVQSFVVHIINDRELSKFDFVIEKEEKTPRWFICGIGFSLVGIIISAVFYTPLASIFILLLSLFVIPFIIEGILNFKYHKLTFIFMIIMAIFCVYLIGLLPFSYFPLILLLLLSPFLLNVLHFKK